MPASLSTRASSDTERRSPASGVMTFQWQPLASVDLSLESHLAKPVPHIPASYFIFHLAISPEQVLFEKFHKATMTIIGAGGEGGGRGKKLW